MYDLPRQQLREIIAVHGPGLADEPARLEALLHEACPGYAPSVELLVGAAEHKVPADLLAAPAGRSWEALSRPLVHRLQENYAEPAARWAVESWGLALGKVKENQLPPPPDPEAEPPVEGVGPHRLPWPLQPLLLHGLRGVCWALVGLNGWAWGGLLGRLAAGAPDWQAGGLVGLALTGALVPTLGRTIWGMRLVTVLGAVGGSIILATAGYALLADTGLVGGFFLGGMLGALASVATGFGRPYRGLIPHLVAGAGCGALVGGLGLVLGGPSGWVVAGALGLALAEGTGRTVGAYAGRADRGPDWVARQGLLGAFGGLVAGAAAGAAAYGLAGLTAELARGLKRLPQPVLDLAGQDRVTALVLILAGVEVVLVLAGWATLAWQGRERPKAAGGRIFQGHLAPVRAVAASADGRWAASGAEDGTARVWDCQTGLEVESMGGHRPAVTSVAFTADGQRLLSGSTDGTVRLWDVPTGAEIRSFRLPWQPDFQVAAALSPDGRLVLAGGSSLGGAGGRKGWVVYLWDADTGEQLRQFKGHGSFFRHGSVLCVAFSPDGSLAVSGGKDRTLRLWDVAGGEEVRRFEGHGREVTGAAFSPDGRHVLSASADRTLRLWDPGSGEEVRRFTGHEGPVRCVAFSPDGRRIVSGGGDRTIRLWDVATGVEVQRFVGQDLAAGLGEVRAVAFLPDGRHVLSGSADHTVRLWEIAG